MIDDMAVYIANLGKYNEGYLVGAWFTFPIDEEDVYEGHLCRDRRIRCRKLRSGNAGGNDRNVDSPGMEVTA